MSKDDFLKSLVIEESIDKAQFRTHVNSVKPSHDMTALEQAPKFFRDITSSVVNIVKNFKF